VKTDTKIKNISSIQHFLENRHWVIDAFAGMCFPPSLATLPSPVRMLTEDVYVSSCCPTTFQCHLPVQSNLLLSQRDGTCITYVSHRSWHRSSPVRVVYQAYFRVKRRCVLTTMNNRQNLRYYSVIRSQRIRMSLIN